MAYKEKDGSLMTTTLTLTDMFYTSRYNRDPYKGLVEGEDENNSRKSRLYNKTDIKDLITLFFEFLENAIIDENISKIQLTKDIALIRDSNLPKLRKANVVDVRRLSISGRKISVGEYYVSKGQYTWRVWFTGEALDRLRALWRKDPLRNKAFEELTAEAQEKNKNANITSTDESSD